MANFQRKEIAKLLKGIFKRNRFFIFIDDEIRKSNIFYNEIKTIDDLISNLYKILSILRSNYLYISDELQEESDLLNLLITQNIDIDQYLQLFQKSMNICQITKHQNNKSLIDMVDRHIQRLANEEGKTFDEIQLELESYTLSCFI